MDRPNEFVRWLADEAPHGNIETLFAAFCREIVGYGLPVWRASLGLEVLHPEVSGRQHGWTDESLSVRDSARDGGDIAVLSEQPDPNSRRNWKTIPSPPRCALPRHAAPRRVAPCGRDGLRHVSAAFPGLDPHGGDFVRHTSGARLRPGYTRRAATRRKAPRSLHGAAYPTPHCR
jgi:hypothetical protein